MACSIFAVFEEELLYLMFSCFVSAFHDEKQAQDFIAAPSIFFLQVPHSTDNLMVSDLSWAKPVVAKDRRRNEKMSDFIVMIFCFQKMS
jgi:hypothetical protein